MRPFPIVLVAVLRLSLAAFGPISLGLAALALPLAMARPAQAADAAEVDQLWRLMLMPEVIEVMRAEGRDYGASLDEDMLGGQGGPGWAAEVAVIYDPAKMTMQSKAAFAEALAGADVSAAIAFFESGIGARAVQLEYQARQTMLDPEADEAAKAGAQEMRQRKPPRLAQLTRLAEANDLFESNVSGAMNANLAFFRGLASGGALDPDMDEAAILTEVWSQEPGVRADTVDWVYSFMTLAYQPLSDAELDLYIAFSESPAGQVLNRATFAAFDDMFVDISYALGAGLAKRLVGENL